MRAVVQRVRRARVTVGPDVTGEIATGLLVLLGIAAGDSEKDADHLVEKITNLRIFDDPDGKMNVSLTDLGGDLMVVSQFTLFADTRRGRRPSFIEAAPPAVAEALYNYFVAEARKVASIVETGRFQAAMEIELVNTGPVTIIIDSKES